MSWIKNGKKKRKPYSYANDEIVIKDKPLTKKQIENIRIISTVWFKTKGSKNKEIEVFRSTLDEVTKNGIEWEYWQPCSKL